MTLTDKELKGDDFSDEEDDPSVADVVEPRLFMGENVPSNVLVLNSRWSMLLKMKQDHILLQRLRDKVPPSIFPQSGDTKESVLRANEIEGQ
jgi:hypothetical protein